MSNTDTLQEQRKNKKEMEFELKLAREKEEMQEREKQLKINRLVQEVSETEREDLEESEKVQHWVERLCQTRLEQISCVENESPELSPPRSPGSEPRVKHFPGGFNLATTDLDDINLDEVDQSLRGPLKKLVPTQPTTNQPPPPLPRPPPSPKLNPTIPKYSPPLPRVSPQRRPPSSPSPRKPPSSPSTLTHRGHKPRAHPQHTQLRRPSPSNYPLPSQTSRPPSSPQPTPHPHPPPPPPPPPLPPPPPPPPPQHSEEREYRQHHHHHHHHFQHPPSPPEHRSEWETGGYLPRGGIYASTSEMSHPSSPKVMRNTSHVSHISSSSSQLQLAPSPPNQRRQMAPVMSKPVMLPQSQANRPDPLRPAVRSDGLPPEMLKRMVPFNSSFKSNNKQGFQKYVDNFDPYSMFSSEQVDGRDVRLLKIKKAGQLELALEGGVDSPLGKLVVCSVYEGGAADKHGGVVPGDELMAVNGKILIDATLEEGQNSLARAWNSGGDWIDVVIAVSPPKDYEDEVTFF
ncbi:harmonin isoform X3 [Xiphophorus hellerii]|nr:harmonin isoform X3 [Xiphophorus hellerii]